MAAPDAAEDRPVVVLDACVLVPMSLRDTLLRAAEAGLYQVSWSRLILAEVRRTLVSREMTTDAQADHLVRIMLRAFPDALVERFEPLIAGLTNAVGDRHVLAAAIASRSSLIVTVNLRDFPDNALRPHGVVALSPDRFLTHLFEHQPDTVAQIIVEQAADLQDPPLTVADILAELARHAPNFIQRLRAYFADGAPESP